MAVQTIIGWDGSSVGVCYSRGASATPYLIDWQDNVLRPPGGGEWPAFLLRQVRRYVARNSWFGDDDANALAAKLGRISKFQSLSSEDALTWSWFGTLALAAPQARRLTVQWLYDKLGLKLKASAEISIDQWLRVVHPNAVDSPNGPELDARIDDRGSALVYVEAKWDAALGTGKGAVEGTQDDQVVLRREAFRVDPELAIDRRVFVVLVVSNAKLDLVTYDEAANPRQRPVRVASTTWSDLALCDAHPLAAEFRRYLTWKQSFATHSRSV